MAIVEEDLFGGSCAFWACMPSKALLHAAAVHHGGGDFPWPKASDFRDWMINREGIDYPDDSTHEKNYRKKGAEPIRGKARIVGTGRVDVAERGGGRRELQARWIVVAVGSTSRIPRMEGLDSIHAWTNREGTSTRTLPQSLLIMGGGPTGVELAQVYARYGVPVTIIDSNDRLVSRDHPRNSAALTEALRREGVTVRNGVRAIRADAGAGAEGAHRVELSDGSSAEGHAILVAIGRAIPTEGLGLESARRPNGQGRSEAGRSPAHRRERVRGRRSGWPGDAHPRRPLRGRDGRPHRAGRGREAGLPGHPARHLHGSGDVLHGHAAGGGAEGRPRRDRADDRHRHVRQGLRDPVQRAHHAGRRPRRIGRCSARSWPGPGCRS